MTSSSSGSSSSSTGRGRPRACATPARPSRRTPRRCAGRSARAGGGRARPRQRRPVRGPLRTRRADRAHAGVPGGRGDGGRSLDEHWNGKGQPDGLKGEAIPILARIACVAQTVEVFHHDRGVAGVRRMLRERRGRWFDPRLADVLPAPRRRRAVDAPRREDDAPAADLGAGRRRRGRRRRRSTASREAFAEVIDAKSPFTSTTPAAWPTTRCIARSSGSTRRAARPAPRGPAARHRQAGRVEPDPRQAGAS